MSAILNSDLAGPGQILEAESFLTTKKNGCVKLRVDKEDEVAGWNPISVPCLLEKAAKEAPDVVALAVKRDEKWVKWTYKEYLQGNL